MITEKAVEATFYSKWLKKNGTVRIRINREKQSVIIRVRIDGTSYLNNVYGVSWRAASMLLKDPGKIADIIIFKKRCVVADNEIWLLQDSNPEWYTVHCLTSWDYREGMTLDKDLSKEKMAKAIVEEPPF